MLTNHTGAAENAVVVAAGPNELPIAARGLYLGTAGDVTGQLIGMKDGMTVTFVGLAAGMVHPLAFKRITAMTATGVLAIG